jgi:hypothetical protein
MPEETIKVSYTLPYILRINRIPFIALSVIFVPLISVIAFELISTGPGNDPVGWAAGLAIAVIFALFWLGFITQQIRLSDDRLSYRKWFVAKEMDYSSLSEISFYYREMGRGIHAPFVELSGSVGEKMAINMLPF